MASKLSKWETLIEEYERLDQKLVNLDMFSTMMSKTTENKIKLLIKGRMRSLLTKINEQEKEVD
jgi:hypothetical protein|tara:strand:+ start:1166 stop:1357 length:192 start_codon:yes stop_codon:yes gene_type:complete